MKYNPCIDLGLPQGENFNPCARVILHNAPAGMPPQAFVYFRFGKLDRVEGASLKAFVNAPLMETTLTQSVNIHGQRREIQELIESGHFTSFRKSNIFRIVASPPSGKHDYWYKVRRNGRDNRPETIHSLVRPESSPRIIRVDVEDIRPGRSEALSLEDFTRITQTGSTTKLLQLDTNPHSAGANKRTFLGLVGPDGEGQDAEGNIVRGMIPSACILIQPDDRLILIIDLSVATQVISGCEELKKSNTFKSFVWDTNGMSRSDATSTEQEDAEVSGETEEEEEEESGSQSANGIPSELAANSNAS